MHKNLSKILFIFFLFVVNLHATHQNQNFQEQLTNLKIEIAVLKSKQEFYDKENTDKFKIIAIENQLKVLTKTLINSRDIQDRRIDDTHSNINFWGILFSFIGILTGLFVFFINRKYAKEAKEEAIEETRAWLENNKDAIINPIKEEAREWKDDILKEQQEELKKHNIDDKIDHKYEDLLEKVEKKLESKDKNTFTFDDWNSKATNEYYNGTKEKAFKYLEKAITFESSDFNLSTAMYKMGVISKELNDNENAIKYYKMAIEKEHGGAMYNLAFLYKEELKDNENAIKYYKMAIEKEHGGAMYNLAILYKKELKDNENTIKYYKMAIEKEHTGAMYNLALLCKKEFKDNENAIKYYKMAIDKKHVKAMNNLAILYKEELKDNDNAIKYYKMAIEKENVEAMYNLAVLYEELKDNASSDKYFKMYEEYKEKLK